METLEVLDSNNINMDEDTPEIIIDASKIFLLKEMKNQLCFPVMKN